MYCTGNNNVNVNVKRNTENGGQPPTEALPKRKNSDRQQYQSPKRKTNVGHAKNRRTQGSGRRGKEGRQRPVRGKVGSRGGGVGRREGERESGKKRKRR